MQQPEELEHHPVLLNLPGILRLVPAHVAEHECLERVKSGPVDVEHGGQQRGEGSALGRRDEIVPDADLRRRGKEGIRRTCDGGGRGTIGLRRRRGMTAQRWHAGKAARRGREEESPKPRPRQGQRAGKTRPAALPPVPPVQRGRRGDTRPQTPIRLLPPPSPRHTQAWPRPQQKRGGGRTVLTRAMSWCGSTSTYRHRTTAAAAVHTPKCRACSALDETICSSSGYGTRSHSSWAFRRFRPVASAAQPHSSAGTSRLRLGKKISDPEMRMAGCPPAGPGGPSAKSGRSSGACWTRAVATRHWLRWMATPPHSHSAIRRVRNLASRPESRSSDTNLCTCTSSTLQEGVLCGVGNETFYLGGEERGSLGRGAASFTPTPIGASPNQTKTCRRPRVRKHTMPHSSTGAAWPHFPPPRPPGATRASTPSPRAP
eukprot:scaffold11076_cov100-Isochrysis_galbana.AAC.6